MADALLPEPVIGNRQCVGVAIASDGTLATRQRGESDGPHTARVAHPQVRGGVKAYTKDASPDVMDHVRNPMHCVHVPTPPEHVRPHGAFQRELDAGVKALIKLPLPAP
jgi:hypothetical protein